MICEICNNEFTPAHHNQKYCSPECKKIAVRRSKEKYKKSDKGKESNDRWVKSERRKENEKRYKSTPEARRKAVLRQQTYIEKHPEAQEKKRKRDLAYGRTEKGKEVNHHATVKYRCTEKGKLNERKKKLARRALGDIDKAFLGELLSGDTCYYCGEKIVGNKTVDHKIPVSRGGTNEKENLCLCCVRCNTQKNNKTEVEYREWLKSNALVDTSATIPPKKSTQHTV